LHRQELKTLKFIAKYDTANKISGKEWRGYTGYNAILLRFVIIACSFLSGI
jgi:hypothetical protein